MARNHGRLLSSIWSDEEFKVLGPTGQRLYAFFISQPNLTHAGVLPLTLRRWARTSHGLTVKDIEADLEVLESARFVVIDYDTEELLVRTLVRNDGIWKQPKVMAAMVASASEIDSPRIKAALLTEVERIPLEELNDEPGTKGGLSTRQQVKACIDTLRVTLRVPEQKGSPDPSGRVSDTPADTPYACAQARSPAPSPTPTPVPPTAGAQRAATAKPKRLKRLKPADDTPESATAQTIIGEYIDRCASRPPGNVIGQLGKNIRQMLDEGIDPDHIRQGMAVWASKGLHPSTLPSVVNEVMNAPPRTEGGAVIPFGAANGYRPSTTDQRVAQAALLVEKYAREGR